MKALIDPEEIVIVGNWESVDSKVRGDEHCERIHWLIENCLEKLAADLSGWETLFRDPIDGRYWERTYPHSGMHGGGPPTLRWISIHEVQSKYPKIFGELE